METMNRIFRPTHSEDVIKEIDMLLRCIDELEHIANRIYAMEERCRCLSASVRHIAKFIDPAMETIVNHITKEAK